MIDIERHVDSRVTLTGDIDKFIKDFVNLVDCRRILAAREQIAQRFGREGLRIIATKQDIAGAKLRNLSLDADIEVINRQADFSVWQERQSRCQDRANDLGLRGFGLEYAQTAGRNAGSADTASSIIARDAISRTIVSHALGNGTSRKVGCPQVARVDPSLREEARLVGQELLEQRRRAERRAIAAAEA